MSSSANLFGTRLFVPTDVITASNVVVNFDEARTPAVCDTIELGGGRQLARLIDLSSGNAVGVASPFQGQLTCRGVVIPARNPIDIINMYSRICNSENKITVLLTSDCDDDMLKVIAKGCILVTFGLVASGSQGISVASTMQFFVGGITIEHIGGGSS